MFYMKIYKNKKNFLGQEADKTDQYWNNREIDKVVLIKNNSMYTKKSFKQTPPKNRYIRGKRKIV